jgi:hypothetical protein
MGETARKNQKTRLNINQIYLGLVVNILSAKGSWLKITFKPGELSDEHREDTRRAHLIQVRVIKFKPIDHIPVKKKKDQGQLTCCFAGSIMARSKIM